jgi:hypothetical protein
MHLVEPAEEFPSHAGIDPSQPQSWNLYSYSLNDPIDFLDPTGERCVNGKDENGKDCISVEVTGRDPGPNIDPSGCYDIYQHQLYIGNTCDSPLRKALALDPPEPNQDLQAFSIAANWTASKILNDAIFAAAGKILGPALAKIGFGSTARETTYLYRAVSEAERADLMATKIFRPGQNSYVTGKFFAETAEHAAQWGNAFYGRGNFTIIEAQFSRSVADQFMRWSRLDAIGPARCDWAGSLRNV